MGQCLASNFSGTALVTVTTASLTAVFSEVYKTCRALQRLKLLINQDSDDSCHSCSPTVARWRSFTQQRARPARGSCGRLRADDLHLKADVGENTRLTECVNEHCIGRYASGSEKTTATGR